MNERIYRTPRAYGPPIDYDIELTHFPCWEARTAEALLVQMARSDAYRDFTPDQLALRAAETAACFHKELSLRSWLLLVEDVSEADKE